MMNAIYLPKPALSASTSVCTLLGNWSVYCGDTPLSKEIPTRQARFIESAVMKSLIKEAMNVGEYVTYGLSVRPKPTRSGT